MTRRQRKALERAYVLIENETESCICSTLPEDINLYDIQEAKAFYPHTAFWWGRFTMGVPLSSPEVRSARLLGLAFMLTMPKDMIP